MLLFVMCTESKGQSTNMHSKVFFVALKQSFLSEKCLGITFSVAPYCLWHDYFSSEFIVVQYANSTGHVQSHCSVQASCQILNVNHNSHFKAF